MKERVRWHTPVIPALGGMDVKGHPALHSKKALLTKSKVVTFRKQKLSSGKTKVM